jgi:hypothetical protein
MDNEGQYVHPLLRVALLDVDLLEAETLDDGGVCRLDDHLVDHSGADARVARLLKCRFQRAPLLVP